MAGTQELITAPTLAELEAKVEQWYADAADMGLEEQRLPWDPELVQEGEDGYGFNVWAHT